MLIKNNKTFGYLLYYSSVSILWKTFEHIMGYGTSSVTCKLHSVSVDFTIIGSMSFCQI